MHSLDKETLIGKHRRHRHPKAPQHKNQPSMRKQIEAYQAGGPYAVPPDILPYVLSWLADKDHNTE